jgi:hypothetical protein
MHASTTPIRVAAAADGTQTYLVNHAPGELPAVRQRDLLAAWDLAREAAHAASWGTGRAIRFRARDGGWTDLALHDEDARCWAAAVDRTLGLQTGYGLSVCLRLLALVELLGRAPWAAGLVRLNGHGADLDPGLLRLAAETQLTDDARFDEPGFRACLKALPSATGIGAAHPEAAGRIAPGD